MGTVFHDQGCECGAAFLTKHVTLIVGAVILTLFTPAKLLFFHGRAAVGAFLFAMLARPFHLTILTPEGWREFVGRPFPKGQHLRALLAFPAAWPFPFALATPIMLRS